MKRTLTLVLLISSISVNAQSNWEKSAGTNICVGSIFGMTADYTMRYHINDWFSTGGGVGLGFITDEDPYGALPIYVSEQFLFHLRSTDNITPFLDVQCGCGLAFDSFAIYPYPLIRPTFGVQLPLKRGTLSVGLNATSLIYYTGLGFSLGISF